MIVIDTLGHQERLRGSWHNGNERKRVIDVLLALNQAGIDWAEVAVITPYVGQLLRLLDDFRRVRIPWIGQDDSELNSTGHHGGVAVGTVHRFQGGERRIVIFSTVVTQEASLGFINERVNLINVAVSRAREHLVVIGHQATLKRGRFSRLLTSTADVRRPSGLFDATPVSHGSSTSMESVPK